MIDLRVASRGLALVFLGLVILAWNFGYVSWGLWLEAAHWWPLLLIALGVNLATGRRLPSVLVLLLAATVVVGLSVWRGPRDMPFAAWLEGWANRVPAAVTVGRPVDGEPRTTTLTGGAIAGVNRLALQVSVVGARLHVGAGADSAVQASVRHRGGAPTLTQQVAGGVARVSVTDRGPVDAGAEWNLRLPPGLVTDIDVNAGAASGQIDLTDLPVESLRLRAGAGEMRVIAGANVERTRIKVIAAGSGVTIAVPRGTGIRLRSATLATTIDRGLELQRRGDEWVSPGIDQASRVVEIDVAAAASNLRLERLAAATGAN